MVLLTRGSAASEIVDAGMCPPRVSSDMADDSWVQRVVDAASVTVSQQNISTVSACPRRKQTRLRSRTRPWNEYERSSPSLPCGCNATKPARWRSTKTLRRSTPACTPSSHFLYTVRKLTVTWPPLGPAGCAASASDTKWVLRSAPASSPRGSDDASPKPGKEQRGANTVLATPEHQYPQDAEHQRSAVLVNFLCGQRLSTASAWFNETSTLVLLKSNARRVVTMLVSN